MTHAPLYNRTQTRRVGHFEAVCFITRPETRYDPGQVFQCNYTAVLSGDEISLQTVNRRSSLSVVGPRDVASVLGGTGRFQNVRGELVLMPPHGPNEVRVLVFRLIP